MRIDVNNENFGIEIKKRLIELGITQRNLAKQLKITDAYLSDILKDNRKALDIRQKIIAIIINIEKKLINREYKIINEFSEKNIKQE